MDRFVNCIEKMESTILVPSRLKDLQIDNEQVSLLGQSDAYGLYLMMLEIRQELLWGPTSGTSTVALELTSNFNNLTLSSDLSSTPKESSVISQKINQEQVQQKLNQQLNLNKLIKCDSSSSLSFCDPIQRLKKQRTFSSTDDGFSSMCDGSSNSLNLSLSGDEAIESNESIDVSSESDCETGSLRMNKESKLETVESKDSFHLFPAFRLHLRGFYSILHQLSDTAEFLTEKYQSELN